MSLTRRPPAPTSGPRSSRGVGVVVHLTGDDDADVVEIDGVPVLAGARLVLDCCAVVPPDSALAIADAAVAKGITSLDALADAARRLRGREVARLVVARTDPLSDNWFESSSRWWLLEAGLRRGQVRRARRAVRGAVADRFWRAFARGRWAG